MRPPCHRCEEAKLANPRNEFLAPLECIDRYLAGLNREKLYSTVSTGLGDPEGRWQAFLDYHQFVYKKLKDPNERLKLKLREDEVGKVEDIAFKLIRKRDFSKPSAIILAGGEKISRKAEYFKPNEHLAELYLSTFQTLTNDQAEVKLLFQRTGMNLFLVIDEAHYIKQIGGNWSSAAIELARFPHMTAVQMAMTDCPGLERKCEQDGRQGRFRGGLVVVQSRPAHATAKEWHGIFQRRPLSAQLS
jgi:hypothetical protein